MNNNLVIIYTVISGIAACTSNGKGPVAKSKTNGESTIANHHSKEPENVVKGMGIVKGIRNNKLLDTVYIKPNCDTYEEGGTYCFFDKTLPRLITDSYCCHPEDLFVCSDMNEDGTHEIGIYYSTCSSRYKSLRIFSLQQNHWKEIGTSTFDILTQDPTKVKFGNLVKKVSKNKFQICSFYEGQTKWETIEMK